MAKVTAKPTVRFSQKAFQQMFALTDACSIEISAMGIVATEEQKKAAGVKEDYYVLEYFVIDQECTGVSTDLDDDAFIELVMELRDRGIKAEQIIVWWHSHVNMGTAHSGTDENQIERFDFDSVCISAITNKKGELNLRIDMFSPFRHTFEKISYTVDKLDILPEGWAEEMIAEHVTTKKIVPQRLNIKKKKTHTNGWSSYTGYSKSRPVVKPQTTHLYGSSSVTSSIDDDDDDFGTWSNGWSTRPDVIGDDDNEDLHISLPTEMSLLESAWEQGLIDAQSTIELYSRWYAKELSTEEVIQELAEVHNITSTKAKEEDEIEDLGEWADMDPWAVEEAAKGGAK